MIRFLYGAGSAETEQRFTDEIKKTAIEGENAILLVPEQETVSAERRLAALLPPFVQLHFEVLNFTRLANRTYRTVGGLQHENITPAAEILLLYRTMRELAPKLQVYKEKTATNPRFCEKILDAKAAFGASLIGGDDLFDAAEKMTDDPILREKLLDLSEIFSAHDRYLQELFGNRRDELAKLPEALLHHGKTLYKDTHLYIDSFTDFTGQELEILRILFSTVKSVTATFPTPAPAAKGLQFLSVLRTEQKLRRFADECGKTPQFQKENVSPRGALQYLRRDLFRMNADPAPMGCADEGSLSLMRCQSPMAEAEYAAYQIHRLVRRGARYRDIVVVVRDATAYTGILDAVLETEGIPCFLSEKNDLTGRPLLKLILTALRILRFGFRHEDVIDYLKTGLCGIDRDDIAFFEEYLNVWSFRGKAAYTKPFTQNPDGLTVTVSPRGARILEIAERVRKAMLPPILTLEKELEEAPAADGQIAAIHHLLTTLKIPEQLRREAAAKLASGQRREAEELARLFSVTVETLQSAITVLGKEKYAVKELQDALKLAFSHTDIGTIPTSVDEVVIGSASMLRADHPRFVIVLGLCEGVFPKNPAKNGMLDRGEQEKLKNAGYELSGDADSAASDELFYVWRAFTAPREKLFLSYSVTDAAGKEATPSIAIRRVRTLFPTLRESVFEAIPQIERIFTLSGAEEHLRDCLPEDRKVLKKLLKEKLPQSAVHKNTPVTDANAVISEELASAVFDTRPLSPSQLERYAGCRFAYYCDHILRLREEAGDTFTSARTGTYIHFVLEKALSRMKENGFSKDLSDREIQDMVGDISAQYRKELGSAAGEFTPRAKALLARLDLMAGIVVRGLFAELKEARFTPAFTELSLNENGTPTRLTLAENGTVSLTGKADRVDFWRSDDGKAYFRVVDYKTGDHKFDPAAVGEGISMQLPLYLLALCKTAHPQLCRALGLPENTPFYPAGVAYLNVGVGSVTTDRECDGETAMTQAIDRITKSGVILQDPDVIGAFNPNVNANKTGSPLSTLDQAGLDLMFENLTRAVGELTLNMRKGLADAAPRAYTGRVPCAYCRFGAICRAAQKTN